MNKMHPVLCRQCGKKFVTTTQARYCSNRCRKITRSNPQSYKYRQGTYLTKSGRREHFDSGFEELHMKILDQKGVSWCRADGIRINYFNPRLRRQAIYIPDFIHKLAKGWQLIELKPYGLINDPVVQAKAEAGRKWARENGMEYQIICSPGQY